MILIGLIAATICVRAQSEPVPAIFVAKPAKAITTATSAVELVASSPLSAGMRQHITEAMFAQVPLTVPSVGKLESPRADPDTIRMDPYIVLPSLAPKLALPRAENAFVRFVKTGTIFYHSGPSFDTRLRLHIWLLQTPPDPHDNKEFTRYELRFSLKF